MHALKILFLIDISLQSFCTIIQTEHESSCREAKNSFNKLSSRRRVPRSPSADTLRSRREGFSNTSVDDTNHVTKYKPLNPAYDAVTDRHAGQYFTRKGVPQILAGTLPELGLMNGKSSVKFDKGKICFPLKN